MTSTSSTLLYFFLSKWVTGFLKSAILVDSMFMYHFHRESRFPVPIFSTSVHSFTLPKVYSHTSHLRDSFSFDPGTLWRPGSDPPLKFTPTYDLTSSDTLTTRPVLGVYHSKSQLSDSDITFSRELKPLLTFLRGGPRRDLSLIREQGHVYLCHVFDRRNICNIGHSKPLYSYYEGILLYYSSATHETWPDLLNSQLK